MHLSKLRLYGFKSFSSKIEVNFPKDGITSIVGPNGCGKSNIIDAIRWVLGEQKVKALRSSKMEDVIFSGTADRPPMNMAEVSLIIENDQGLLPVEHTHVMITRQAFRNGDSVYMMNGQPCRLKDIHHLFYDTGMGAASYSVMEQKMIDSILSEKDDERRVLFEEASGISKYKKYRTETGRQLERVSLDLERVEDNLRHTRQSVKLFERQAKKAEQWRELQKQAESLELSFQSDRYTALKSEAEELSLHLGRLQKDANAKKSEITVSETRLEEEKLKIFEYEKAYSEKNQVVSNSRAEGERLSNAIRISQERIKYLRQSLEKKEKDVSLTHQKMAEYGQEKIRLRALIEESLKKKSNAEEEHTIASAKLSAIQSRYESDKSESDRLQDHRVLAIEEASHLKNELGGFRTGAALVREQLEKLSSARERAEHDRQVMLEEAQQLELEYARLDSVLSAHHLELETKQTEQRASMEQLDIMKEEQRVLENGKITLETQIEIMKSVNDSRSTEESGTGFVLGLKRESLIGALLDHISVPEEYAVLLDECLGDSLATLLFSEKESISEIMALLGESRKGNAFMYAFGNGVFKRPRPDLSHEAGFSEWLIDHIAVGPELKNLLEHLIGHYALVQDRACAFRLSDACRSHDIWFVTREGDRIHTSGAVSGGFRSGAEQGPLFQKHRLEQAASQLAEVSKSFSIKEKDVISAQQKLNDLTVRMGELQKKIKEEDEGFRDVSGRLAVVKNSFNELENRSRESDEAKNSLRAKLSDLEIKIAPLAEALGEKEQVRHSIEERFSESQSSLRETESGKARLESGIRDLEIRINSIRSEIENARNRLLYLDESEKEQSAIQTRMDLDGQEWESEIEKNNEKIAGLNSQMAVLNERLEKETGERDSAKAIYDTKVVTLDEIREMVRALNKSIHDLTQQSHGLEMKLEQAQSAAASIRERMFELHEKDLDDETLEFERVEYNPDTVEDEIRERKETLKRLGSVNPGALEDYEQEKAQLERVQQQFDDLERARAGLKRAIRKLDRVAREQFVETFQKIQENFQDVFSTLFEGGQAKLTLEEGADPLEAKIEINGSPSGKKMRGIALLSGGERALTAISLLFSLYLVRPSPYCIMDEVDGPLDDANIGRFINLLRRFSKETQFLVVTHNKRTMAASDTLYGVTQEIKGISKLASVRLDDTSMIAA